MRIVREGLSSGRNNWECFGRCSVLALAACLFPFTTGILFGDEMTPEQKERQKKAVATVQRLTSNRGIEWDFKDNMIRVALNGLPADTPESVSEILADLGPFRDLELSRAVANESELEAVSRLTFLESCAIGQALATDEAPAYLTPLTNLTYVSFGNGPFTGARLGELRACPKLEWLNLFRLNKLSPDAANQVCEIRSLRRLSVDSTPVTDADVVTLVYKKDWKYLQFSRTNITDAAIASLVTLPHLTHLDIGEDGVTSAGIQSLAESKSIEWLDLRFSKNLDDATIDALAKMPRLRKVMLLDRNNISAEAVKRLAAQRPKLLIQHPATDHYQKVGLGGFME
jgi:hypothetical protein